MSGLLPTGTVTLLLADVEGSTRLWETQPGEMTAAIARLNQAVSDIIATHDGVRPVEQGEGDQTIQTGARPIWFPLNCGSGRPHGDWAEELGPTRSTHSDADAVDFLVGLPALAYAAGNGM